MTTKSIERHTCRKCGRGLTDPRSIARGYGPKCFSRMSKVAATHKPAQLEKALELIADAGIVPMADPERWSGFFVVIASNGADRYHTTAVGCTCTAGRYGRTCYHQVAAKLLVA